MEGHGVGGGGASEEGPGSRSSSPMSPPPQHSHVSSPDHGTSPEEDEKEEGHSWREGPPPSPGKPGLAELTSPEADKGLGDGLVQTPEAQGS